MAGQFLYSAKTPPAKTMLFSIDYHTSEFTFLCLTYQEQTCFSFWHNWLILRQETGLISSVDQTQVESGLYPASSARKKRGQRRLLVE